MRRRSQLRSTWPAKIPLRPMMTRMLKTAEPTIVPTPTSPLVMKTPEGWQSQSTRECLEKRSKVDAGELR